VADFTRDLRRLDSRMVTIQQWAAYGVMTSSAVAEGYYAFSNVLTDLPDNANYTAIYDQYKFECVEYHILPVTQKASPASSVAYAFALVYHDYDDANSPSSLTNARSVMSAVVLAPGERHIRRIKPHNAVAASNSGSTITGVKNMPADWIDCTSSSVPHYGLKAVITQSTSTSLSQWYVWAKITVSFRSQR